MIHSLRLPAAALLALVACRPESAPPAEDAAATDAAPIRTDDVTPPGFSSATAVGINNAGVVVGFGHPEDAAPDVNAPWIMISGGTPQRLPLPEEYVNGRPTAIARNGSRVVGWVSRGPSEIPETGVYWDSMTVKVLDLGPNATLMTPTDVTDGGAIVGTMTLSGGTTRAFFYARDGVDAGRVTDLGTYGDGQSSFGMAVNNQGDVAGCATTAAGALLPVKWTGADHRIQVLSGGTCATDITDNGEVVVEAGVHAQVIPQSGGPQTWSGGPGFLVLGLSARNAAGYAAGTGTASLTAADGTTFLRTYGLFGREPLSDGSAPWRLPSPFTTEPPSTVAYDINDSCQIAGFVTGPTGPRAVVWTMGCR
jgi:probable HAF family extracellular repeat protein